MNPEALHQAILDRLSKVIDPETGVDVVRMRLIEDLAEELNKWLKQYFEKR
jgi:metal-sulfur cluster biosynthetic enzyme